MAQTDSFGGKQIDLLWFRNQTLAPGSSLFLYNWAHRLTPCIAPHQISCVHAIDVFFFVVHFFSLSLAAGSQTTRTNRTPETKWPFDEYIKEENSASQTTRRSKTNETDALDVTEFELCCVKCMSVARTNRFNLAEPKSIHVSTIVLQKSTTHTQQQKKLI